MPKPWTAVGCHYLAKEAVRDAKNLDHTFAELAGDTPAGGNDDRLEEWHSKAASIATMLEPANLRGQMLREIEPAPEPTSTSVARLGLKITVRNTETSGRLRAGHRQTVILGGEGENHSAAEVLTVSSSGPLARAVVGKTKGDIVQVGGPQPYEVEIVSIAYSDHTRSKRKAK